VRWSVVEQPKLVEVGQREFARGPLAFYASIADCCEAEQPNAVLLSAVLPYLEDPHGLLAEIAVGAFRHVIVDRTGFVWRGRDRLTVQHVPGSIYDATYPAWFFNRTRFLAPFDAEWRVLEEWVTNDDVDIEAEHRGMLLEKKAVGPIPVAREVDAV
jgi:putative methyltransferase (TIGR04325 family)